MKNKIWVLLTILATAIHANALAAQTPLGGQDLAGSLNYLLNAGFENGTYGWTASGGATKTVNSTAKGEGNFGYDWDSNSASQTLISNSITIPNGLQGRNGIAFCSFKTPSGSATHTLTVDDGTNNLVSPVSITSSAGFSRTTANFIFPSSGSVRLKITSVASNEPEIYIDSCYLGEATNLSQVSQAQLYGTVSISGCSAAWTTTSTTLASFSAKSGCSYAVTGNASAPGTNIPAIAFTNLPPGNYVLQAEGSFQNSSGFRSFFQFSDGTNTATELSVVNNSNASTTAPGINQSIQYTTAQSNVTLQIKSMVISGGTTDLDAESPYNLVIKVFRFPLTSELAVRPDTLFQSWSGYHNVASGWVTSSGTFGDPSAGSGITLTELTNTNAGTVTTAASSLPGIIFPVARAGTLEVCAYANGTQTSAETPSFRIVDGSGTVLTPGVSLGVPTSFYANFGGCGFYKAAAAASVTFKVQFAVSTSSWNQGAGKATGAPAIFWTVRTVTQNITAPIFVGSVTSNTSGTEHVERISFGGNSSGSSACTSSTCTIVSQSGSWASAPTRSAAGTYNIVIAAGEFSSVPSCTCTPQGISTVDSVCVVRNSSTSTSIDIKASVGSTGAAGDDTLNLICMGPH